MLLYHGTTEKAARAALIKGLRPRKSVGIESNWEECPSSPYHVYLTSAYAPYFAMSACEEGNRWAILEVDTEQLIESDLFPDEDFLEQVSRTMDLPESWELEGVPMVGRTEWFRNNLSRFQPLWEKSVELLGNCSHFGPIPVNAITRVAVIDPKTCIQMTMLSSGPMITLGNFSRCGNHYKSMTRWFMGEDIKPEDISSTVSEEEVAAIAASPDVPPGVVEHFRQKRASYEETLADRSGVEIINIGGSHG